MKKIFLLAFIMFFSLTLGCTQYKGNKLNLALDWSINTAHIGLIVAKEKGFYKEENLDINLVPLGKTSILSLLAFNKVDLALSSQGETIFAKDQGASIESIATLLQHHPSCFFSLQSKDIQKPEDLNKKIYGGWGSSMEELVISKIISYNRKIKKPIVHNHLIGDMNIVTALQNLDFIWGFKGWEGIQLTTMNIKFNCIPISQYLPVLDTYAPIIVANPNNPIYKEHPEYIHAFLKATEKAYIWAKENPEEATEIMLKYDSSFSPKVISLSMNYLKQYFLDKNGKWGRQDPERYQKYMDFMYSEKILQHILKSDILVNNKFFEKK